MTAEIIELFPQDYPDLSADQAFDLYVQTLPKGALLCRANQQHRFPDWGAKSSKASRRNGITLIEAACTRHCGTVLTTTVDPDGYITRRRTLHYGDSKYLIPPEARDGRGLSKAKNARFRQELLIRNAEWITEE